MQKGQRPLNTLSHHVLVTRGSRARDTPSVLPVLCVAMSYLLIPCARPWPFKNHLLLPFPQSSPCPACELGLVGTSATSAASMYPALIELPSYPLVIKRAPDCLTPSCNCFHTQIDGLECKSVSSLWYQTSQ